MRYIYERVNKGFEMVLFTMGDDSSRSHRLETYIKDIANDNMTSLRLLYEETSAGVYSFTLSMLKNREDAEDAMQDVYLSIHKSACLYTPMGRPMEWIMTVTRNICISKLRDRKRLSPMDAEDEPAEFPQLFQSEDRILLSEALQILSDEERKVVTLRSVAGLKHSEVAAVLGIPPATVRSKYRRALKKLKQYLTKGGAYRE